MLVAQLTCCVACVASVSVRFRSKERGTRVKDRAKNGASKFFGSCFISRAAKTENPVPRSFFVPKPNGNACYAGYMLCTLVQCCALNLQECVIMLNVERLSWIINFECWNVKLKVGCYNLMLAAQVKCWVLRRAVVIPFGHSLYLQHFTYMFVHT